MSPADALAVTSCRTCVTAGVRKTLVGSGSSHHLEWSQPGLESARRGLARTSSGGSQSRIYTSNLYSVNPWGGAVPHPDSQHAWSFLAMGVEHWRSPSAPARRERSPAQAATPALARLLWLASRWHHQGAHAGQSNNGTKGRFSNTAHEQCRDLGKASEPASPQPWKRLSGSAQWKEPAGSWQLLGSETLPNNRRCARDRDKQKKTIRKPARLVLLSQ